MFYIFCAKISANSFLPNHPRQSWCLDTAHSSWEKNSLAYCMNVGGPYFCRVDVDTCVILEKRAVLEVQLYRIWVVRPVCVFSVTKNCIYIYTGRTKVMLVESSYCKPFPPRILLVNMILVNFHPGKAFYFIKFKTGWILTVPHPPRKMDMIIRSGTDQVMWLKPSTSANFLPVEVWLLCFSWCPELSKICFKFHINATCSLVEHGLS